MPELPEVESARAMIEQAALGRVIADVDDSDSYECRPHRPGEIRAALNGRRLTAVHRQGKSMWCDTSGTGRSRVPGPALGLHLGMSGKIIISDGHGGEVEGGDYWRRGAAPHRSAPARPGPPRPAGRRAWPRCPRDHASAVQGRVRARHRAGEG